MVGKPGYREVSHSVPDIELEAPDTDMPSSPGKNVTSPEAAVVRDKVWAEILDVLRGIDPEIRMSY